MKLIRPSPLDNLAKMTLAERIAEQVAKMPSELRQILDFHLGAGNELIDLEIGRGKLIGTTVLVMNHPFKIKPASLPSGVQYREITDRDPMLFQYSTADEKWLLLTAKLKPMVFEKLQAPPDPMPAHLERMEKIHQREEAAANARAANKIEYIPPSPDPSLGEAGQTFLSSMKINFDMWHDGLGYDLDALKKVPDKELASIESILIRHSPRDWRDIEALARIDSPKAQAAVQAALKHSDPAVRREAMHYFPEKIDPKDREMLLLKSLETAAPFAGLTEALDEVEKFHPPTVIDALLRRTLSGGDSAVHFAAMLYFLRGKSKEAFDWDHRPFFLRFNATDRNELKTAFRELCETIGLDVHTYLKE